MNGFLIALPGLLISVVAHEYAHGFAALQQGDKTAAMAGRLTLNPIKHIDPFMTVLLPILIWTLSSGSFVFGGAKPVPVDPRNFKEYRKGDLIVSSAGIFANLVLFGVFALLCIAIGLIGRSLPGLRTPFLVLQQMALAGIWLNALLAFFNLIPIPPLDGSRILYHLLPPAGAQMFRQISRFGFLILFGLMIVFQDMFFVLLAPAIWLTELAFVLVAPFILINGAI